MSANTRLTRLLNRGFYPVELPPVFRTRNYSTVAQYITQNLQYWGATTFYDGATFKGHLRTFGVINPVSYLFLSRHIAQNWGEISPILRLSRCTGARPKFPPLAEEGRAITVATIATQRTEQRHLASSFPVIATLDINRFYGSIYTHSIPWAALGKETAKVAYANHTLGGTWSDVLDRLARNCNQRQTVGLAIGPDTSRILSEMLLARIDSELTATGSGLASPQVFHNIDDYQIGVLSVSEAEDAQSTFVKTIARYELRINDYKTSIDSGIEFSPANFQRRFDILRGQSGRNLIEHFFEILYEQIASNPDSNVVGYTLKRFARPLIRNPEQSLLREYLQRLLLAAPHQARWIMPLLLGIYRRIGINSEIRRILHWGIETSARRNDVGSIVWFLYTAIFLRIGLTARVCDKCIGMSNELVDLMLFHGQSISLFSFSLPRLRQRYRNADFRSSSWLTLYEVERRAWDTSPSFRKIGTNLDISSYYETMRQHSVEFYSTRAEHLDVAAFDGWGLTQDDFEPQAYPDIDWDALIQGGDDENYE